MHYLTTTLQSSRSTFVKRSSNSANNSEIRRPPDQTSSGERGKNKGPADAVSHATLHLATAKSGSQHEPDGPRELVRDRTGVPDLESARLTPDLLGAPLRPVVIWFVFGFWVA